MKWNGERLGAKARRFVGGARHSDTFLILWLDFQALRGDNRRVLGFRWLPVCVVSLVSYSLVGAFALIGCGPPPKAVGTSNSGGEPSVTLPADGGAAIIAPDFKSRLKKVGERFVSNGHAAGRWEAELFANGLAESVWSGDESFPVGSELLLSHTERQGDKSDGPVMAMKKGESGWSFSVMNSRGEPITGRGLNACDACHKDAPRDHVFPMPKSAAN